jgi:cell division GTPase FtsZ
LAFGLISFAKKKMKTNINPFTSAMTFELKSGSNDDETLKHINTYFINEFIGIGAPLIKKETKVDFSKAKPLLAAFAIVSGPNRAKKAIELTLSQPLFSDKISKNSNTILLLISTHTIEVDIDEIGEINDYIQEIAGYNAPIIMSVSEDENLGEGLSVTIILSQSDNFKI